LRFVPTTALALILLSITQLIFLLYLNKSFY
jgi:hypothetical protein